MTKVERGIADAAAQLSPAGGAAAARAIMTTDPFPKESAVEVVGRRGTFRVGGMAKGSGMIEPLMATMLGFVTTDAAVAPALLQRALKAAVDETFNAITVDGECSTNDCVFVAGQRRQRRRADREQTGRCSSPASRAVCEPLAIGIVRGGEGATKLITVRVAGAASNEDARADRARDRQLAAREDGHARRRSELGPARRRGRTLGLGVHARKGRRAHRSGELFADGTPYDDRAPEAAEYLQGKEIDVKSISAPAGRAGRACGHAT